jgi:hypothetical protein
MVEEAAPADANGPRSCARAPQSTAEYRRAPQSALKRFVRLRAQDAARQDVVSVCHVTRHHMARQHRAMEPGQTGLGRPGPPS